MKISNNFKNSVFFSFLIYVRYLYKRYFVEKKFKNQYMNLESKIESINGGISFFGYYNISPQNHDGDILYLNVANEIIRGSTFEPAKVMIRRHNSKNEEIGQTYAWNWQQGCMLQWLPGTNSHIIFNDFDIKRNKYIAEVINKKGQTIKTFNKAVNNISKDGKFALSLNYDRLKEIRPDYGYFKRSYVELPPLDEDGIWKIDLRNGNIELIITLKDLAEQEKVPSMIDAFHLVNHIDISPDGRKFMFLHRWIGSYGRLMRLIICDSNGQNLRIINGDKMTSHSCWLNNNDILSFCNYKGKIGYFVFSVNNLKEPIFLNKMPLKDGHPSVSPCGNWILTDTYPSKARFSYIYLYNIKNDKLYNICQLHQPLKYQKEFRIDLHPKWSSMGTSIFFESGHEGKRKLYKAEIVTS